MESNNRIFADISETLSDRSESPMALGMPAHVDDNIDHQRLRYPHCIVWTPIPCLTYVTRSLPDNCNYIT